MSINKFEKDMNIIKALPDEPNDVGGLTAEELKNKFDEGGIALQQYINETLLPQLEGLGVEEAILLPDGAGFKYMRLNADKVLETSVDGKVWEASGSSGHIVVDAAGKVLPQRSRIKFAEGTVTDDGTQTIVHGVVGPQGPQGPRGYPAIVNGKTPDAEGKITITAEDVGARPDTWLPTIGEIGAAPSGYGLGESVGRYCADCHAVTKGGLYYADNSTSNLPGVGVTGVLLVQNVPATNGTDIYLTLTSGANIWHCYYSSWADAWQPWECENPPLTLGVEYRTTERHNGKVVYAQAIDFGAMPNSSNKSVYVNDGITGLVRVEGYCNYYTGSASTPFATVSFVSDVEISYGRDFVAKTSQDASTWNGYPILYYTKD